MKKTYMVPAIQADEAQAATIMAVSLQEGSADPNTEVLTKENEWSIWGDEE